MYEVKFNTEFHRWEVYRTGRMVIRGGEFQPVFVNADLDACEAFVRRATA